MLDSLARKVTHELSGTRRGVSVTVKLKAPAALEIESVMDNIDKFVKNQIDATVPKTQEKMKLDKTPSKSKSTAPKPKPTARPN